MPVCSTPSVMALAAPWASRALVPEETEGVEMAQASSEGWACGVELSGGEETGRRRSPTFRTAFPYMWPQFLHLGHGNSTWG